MILYEELPSKGTVDRTAVALQARGFEVLIVENKAEALEAVVRTIPHGASVINGGSKTLREIGFNDYLKDGAHGWNNLHEAILAEKDPQKQKLLRKQASLADYFIGSVNAVSETGELVIASGSGSQLPSIAFNSDNVILVVGTHKITPTLEAALNRVRNYVVPLEDIKMKTLGHPGTLLSKILLYEKHSNRSGKRVLVIFVNEKLGF